MYSKVTFDRQPNGQFTPQVSTPQPMSNGEGAGYAILAAALGAVVWAGGKYLLDKLVEKKDEK